MLYSSLHAMSKSGQMIDDLDTTLIRLLTFELERIPGCPVRDAEQITFESPVIAEMAQDGGKPASTSICLTCAKIGISR